MFLGEYQLPLDAAALAGEAQGEADGAGHREYKFTFRHRGIAYAVRYRNQVRTAQAQISFPLGRLPYSAESPQQRPAIMAILRAMTEDFGRVLTLQRGKIQFQAEIPLQVPVTAVSMVTEITGFLLRLKPYLDLMALVRTLP